MIPCQYYLPLKQTSQVKKGRYDRASYNQSSHLHLLKEVVQLPPAFKRGRAGVMAYAPYEAFDHTADIGLHAYGQTLPELFSHAAAGMESLMVAPEKVEQCVSREVSAEGHDLVSLLVAWLNELIFLFDTDYLLFNRFEISDFTGTHLRATVYGEPYD